MKLIICLACTWLFLQQMKSQDSLISGHINAHQPVLATISFSGNQSIKVHIMDIRDSALFVYQKVSGKPDPFHKTNIYVESNWDSYHYTFIQSVKVTNKKVRSWLLPVSIVGGVIAGALIGYAAAKDDGGIDGAINQGAGIFFGGVIGGGLGTATGLLISNAYDQKYMINGEWKSFEEMKKSMNY